jgi:redox-sensitive bicupin YhaK (pirin superfamily)
LADTQRRSAFACDDQGKRRATHLLLFAGRPLREPVVFGGPFVMNTQEQIDEAFADFRAGRF